MKHSLVKTVADATPWLLRRGGATRGGFGGRSTGHISPMTERPVVKRTARAVLLDADEMILIKRTKPGRLPYWITPGGGVEPGDPTVIDALHREVDEELGAKITDVVPVFVDTVEHMDESGAAGVKVQHFFVCRLESMDVSQRHGPEVDQPCGEYAIVRIPFTRMGLASVEIVPLRLRHYLDRNIEGVRAMHAPDFS